jgi:hypothetical protein
LWAAQWPKSSGRALPLLERVAAAGDVLQVQLGATPDQVRHGVGRERRQRIGVRADPGEEIGIADQRHLDRLGHTGDLIAAIERRQEAAVVDHRERWRKRTEQILRAEMR